MSVSEQLHKMMLRPGFQARVDQDTLLAGKKEIDRLRAVLFDAKLKLQLYRKDHSGEYVGGVEYTELMRRIDEALA